MKKLKVLDLFSGIGGFSLGLERTGGFDTVAFCEIDEAAVEVLKKRWPGVPVFVDVCEMDEWAINDYLQDYKGPIDVICGGFPCQDISTANVKGEGIDGERSGLWVEYKRLIREIKPRYAIIENVANLRSRGLARVMQDLNEVGYDAEWQIISGYGTGSPHQRERIYIVAWRRDIPYCNPFRSWATYNKKEKTKQEWWSERQFERDAVFGEVTSFEPKILRDFDGLSKESQQAVEEQIKQYGNAIIPQIPQLIGQAILESENLIDK